MKLFTQEINKKLFAQYSKGSDLSNQMVVAKIFNPYGRGTWYLINSDEDDPDYLWAIVDLFEVEVGSVSRKELESIKIKPFNFGLERDLSFSPKNAEEVFKGLLSGKTYAKGGKLKYDPTRDVVAIAIKDGVFNKMFTKGDFLGGAYQMESGGVLKDYNYVSPRNIIFARLKSGEDIKPVNGFYIRKNASGTVMTEAASKPLKKASVKSLKISIPRPILLTASPSKSPKMMKFIGTFSGKDLLRPAMTFVQVKEGSIVATDAYKLIRIIDGSTLKEDKLVCESTKCRNEKPDDQKFPIVSQVINSIDSEFSESYDMVELYESLMQVRNDDLKNKVSKMERVIELKLENQTIYFSITLLLQCVKGCLLLGWKKAFISYSQGRKAIVFTEERAEGRVYEVPLILLMPILGSESTEKVTVTPKMLLEQGGMMGEGAETMIQPTILQNNPNYLVGTESMYEMFEDGGIFTEYEVYRNVENLSDMVIFKGDTLIFRDEITGELELIGNVERAFGLTKREFLKEERELKKIDVSEYPKDLLTMLEEGRFKNNKLITRADGGIMAKGGEVTFEADKYGFSAKVPYGKYNFLVEMGKNWNAPFDEVIVTEGSFLVDKKTAESVYETMLKAKLDVEKPNFAGGRLLTTRERYILELKGLITGYFEGLDEGDKFYNVDFNMIPGVTVESDFEKPDYRDDIDYSGYSDYINRMIDTFIQTEKLTDEEILNAVIGLGRRQLDMSDFLFGIDLRNPERNINRKEIIRFIKSDKAMRLADGGSIPEGYHQMPDGSIMADSMHMAKGGAMEHMVFKGDKVLAIHRNMVIVESDNGVIQVVDFRQEPIARRMIVETITGKNTLASAMEYIDSDPSFKTSTMAVGGSLRSEQSDLVEQSLNEQTLQQGTKLRYDKNNFVIDYVVDKEYKGSDGFPKYTLKVVKSNYPSKIKIGSTEEYESSKLGGLMRNGVIKFIKNESVNEKMAMGGSLQGHGFEVGDLIVEDLGGYIRVTSEDGKDFFITLRTGDRETEAPLPFKHGGKVKHSDVTRLATKTNEAGDEVVDLADFYEEGGNVPQVFDVPAQFLDSDGQRKNDRKTIRELTDFVLALPQTKEIYFNQDLGDYTPSRKKLHAEIINKFKKEVVCINNDKPIAIFMGGSPASGKSSFLRKYSPFLLKEEILKIDADEIRAMLPEYEGWNAAQTHLETKDIVNILLSNKNIGIPCDFDIIYDGTMNSVKSYIPLMDILRKRGYKIFIVFMDNVPKDVIIKRALDRYKSSGRFVPLEVIDDFFTKGKSAFNELKKDVDGYIVVDGSNQDYRIIEEGGIKLPRDRKYSKLGTKINPSDIPVSYKKGGMSKLY